MQKLAIALIMGSVLAFVLALILVLVGGQSLPLIHTGAEGYSRASSNLALIAIALGVWFRPGEDD